MIGKVINNKLVIQNKKRIFSIELNELQLKALKMQEVEEFEIKTNNTAKKFEDLYFLDIISIIYYTINKAKVLKKHWKEKGFNKLEIRFIEERKAEETSVMKTFSKKIDNTFVYTVFTVKAKEGYFTFQDKLYTSNGEVKFKLDEYSAEKINDYSEFLEVLEEREVVVPAKSSYDHTQDIADSYNITD